MNEGCHSAKRATLRPASLSDIFILERASGIIVEEGGLTSHGAIAAIHYKKPAIIGINYLMGEVEDGQIITLDAISGIVYDGAAKVI